MAKFIHGNWDQMMNPIIQIPKKSRAKHAAWMNLLLKTVKCLTCGLCRMSCMAASNSSLGTYRTRIWIWNRKRKEIFKRIELHVICTRQDEEEYISHIQHTCKCFSSCGMHSRLRGTWTHLWQQVRRQKALVGVQNVIQSLRMTIFITGLTPSGWTSTLSWPRISSGALLHFGVISKHSVSEMAGFITPGSAKVTPSDTCLVLSQADGVFSSIMFSVDIE